MSDVILVGAAGAPMKPRGRLIFALDATASREPGWDVAVKLQAEMFRSTAPIGMLQRAACLLPGRWRMSSVQVGGKRRAARTAHAQDQLRGRHYADR